MYWSVEALIFQDKHNNSHCERQSGYSSLKVSGFYQNDHLFKYWSILLQLFLSKLVSRNKYLQLQLGVTLQIPVASHLIRTEIDRSENLYPVLQTIDVCIRYCVPLGSVPNWNILF